MEQDKERLIAVPKLPGLQPRPLPNISTPRTSATQSSDAALPRPSHSHLDSRDSQETVNHEYNVYAQSYIPLALRLINTEPAQVIITEAKHQIDFALYTATFAGKSFIPFRLVLGLPGLRPSLRNAEQELTEESYLPYFLALFRIECAAQEQENETYSLYKVPLIPMPMAVNERLYPLSIPGLREDNPLIEMGDTIQLRQLCLDQFKKIGVWEQQGDPQFHPPVHRTWTGIQHDASVHAVNRAQEKVYLKITSLQPTPLVVFVNAVLPLKMRHLQRQWNSLQWIYQELLGSNIAYDRPLQGPSIPSGVQLNGNNNHSTGGQRRNDWVRKMLFPRKSDGTMQTELRKIPKERGLFDHHINYEQLCAINSACELEFGVLPFLISGPPGTGKTKTLVEISMQLLDTTQVAHILICAPSDPAADTLALRLRQYMSPKQLLRLNGPQRADNEVPRELLPYCYIEHDMFNLPPFPQLMTYNVIVTSTRDASMLVDARIANIDLYCIERNVQSAFNPENPKPPQRLHWGALLMDEAAQATELDALSALSIVMPPFDLPDTLEKPRFIMAGDQNQLGPRTASRNPQYSTSLFARLFDRRLYKEHPLSRSRIKPSVEPPVLTAAMLPMLYPPFVNLHRNYRSHPAILSTPSSLFYHDTLIPEATLEPTSSSLPNSSLWVGKKWPILYIPHTGPDEIERDGGGWYNITEARTACDIAQRLVYESGVAQTDIVIMSPFAAQVKLLRSLIRSSTYGGGSGLWDINIGPLEAFQGLESRVVIICTTRTRERFLEADAQHGLGIIGQQKKMNVALTRAKMGLVVIGNPNVLAKDPHWLEWLAFCWRNGLVSGTPFDATMIESFRNCKVGILERAMLVKEEKQRPVRRMLGSAADEQNIIGEDWGADLAVAIKEAADEDTQELYDSFYEEDSGGDGKAS